LEDYNIFLAMKCCEAEKIFPHKQQGLQTTHFNPVSADSGDGAGDLQGQFQFGVLFKQ
jgi:hypothetical protein